MTVSATELFVLVFIVLFLFGLFLLWLWPGRRKNQIWTDPPEPIIEPLICGDDDDKHLNEMSGTWLFIKDWALSEIETARKKNDASLDVEKTAALRGEIRALKRLANLPTILTSRDNRLKYNAATDGAGGEDDDE